MYIYFVDESNKAYYMSPMFGRILAYLNAHPRRVEIRRNTARRSFAIANVKSVATAVAIARRTIAIARQNVWFAIGVKVAVLVLAAVGLGTMWMAVFADVGVTVLAVLNAMRALRG